MENSTLSSALTGVVPPVCDAEAGERRRRKSMMSTPESSNGVGSSVDSQLTATAPDQTCPSGGKPSAEARGLSVRRIQSVMRELCSAVRSALDDERGRAEESLRRAAEILQDMGETEAPIKEQVRGGLCPWQIRKVTNHVEAHLDRPIRNEDLATIVRLNPSHFGHVFRNSFGEPPHEYVIRRRIERAQGIMLSTDASLSEIALDCGLADQSHLTRLFRRVVGESPRAWRRARASAPP